MTRNEFMALCQARSISPDIALENDEVAQAIRANDIALLITLLDTQF